MEAEFPRNRKPFKTVSPVFCLATGHRAKAAVLMRAKFILTTSIADVIVAVADVIVAVADVIVAVADVIVGVADVIVSVQT